tara:strand:- start:2682 stop:2903 length:222 start_codon:yes stop_codon:yes gene_type:complete
MGYSPDDPANPDRWTRGDPLAPPHVKDSWDREDLSTLPEDASPEKPYAWNWLTGEWDLQDPVEDYEPEGEPPE